VLLADDSLLAGLFGGKVQVPAAHHQAPDRLADGLTLVGWSPDDEVVEALEVAGHRFGVGVHWHPEEGDDPRLLAALIEAAAEPRRDQPKRQESQQPQQPKKPPAPKPKTAARTR
jgi:putative glutamine amidotransferase